jgi:hypothetical protein
VLASSFLVAWLATSRLVSDGWGLGWELAIRFLAVSLLQLLALWLLFLLAPKLFGRTSGPEDGR